jgi:ankyrin repeat protein
MKDLFRIAVLLGSLILVVFILFLISLRDRRPRIYFAAEAGDTNLIAHYLALGTNVNTPVFCSSPTEKHESAPIVEIAAVNGRLNTIKFLLANGANPNQLDSDGNTPLLCALGSTRNDVAPETRAQILKMLLDNGADPNLASSNGFNTPLIEASLLGQTDAAKILLANGARVGQANNEGSTPLHFAGNAEIARLLISAGADAHTRTAGQEGETPVESARRLGHIGTLEVLTNLSSVTNK